MNSTQDSNTTKSESNLDLEMMIITTTGKALLVTALAITTVAIFAGNVLVLAVLHRQKKTANQRVITMFIANLSFIDLMVSLFNMPISLATYLYGRWPFGETFCVVNGFTTMVTGLIGILTMTAIAVDR